VAHSLRSFAARRRRAQNPTDAHVGRRSLPRAQRCWAAAALEASRRTARPENGRRDSSRRVPTL
jgi:hypothetical protein